MFSFGSKKQDGSTAAIFHVSSDSVSAALVTYTTRGTTLVPTVLGSVEEFFPTLSDFTFERFQFGMSQAFTKAAERLIALKVGSPNTISVTLGAPWYVSQVRSVFKEQTLEYTLTKSLLDSLITEERKTFAHDELTRYENAGESVTVLEQELISVALNGYPTANPIGKKTKKLELTLLLSMSPKTVTDEIRRLIEHAFHRSDILFHSFLFSSTVVARDLFALHEHFLCVDVGAEVTDVACIKNGSITHIVSFPSGHAVLVRTIANKLSVSADEARSLLELSILGKLDTQAQEKLSGVLGAARDAWVLQFKAALSELAMGDFLLPHTVIATADHELAKVFTDGITQESLAEWSGTGEPFSIALLNNDSLAPFIASQSKEHTPSRLLVNALFYARKEHTMRLG